MDSLRVMIASPASVKVNGCRSAAPSTVAAANAATSMPRRRAAMGALYISKREQSPSRLLVFW
jgi:hypothetical protein